MTHHLALSLLVALVLLFASVSGAGETFPVVHNEPITIHIVDGKDGQPLAHVHLSLVAGYDQHDLHLEMWRQEALTDDHGSARLPDELANLPFLQVTVAKSPLCANSHSATFSIDRIRNNGLSAPNSCGIATAEAAPGVFTVFVKRSDATQKTHSHGLSFLGKKN
jgi:hypothetical protein